MRDLQVSLAESAVVSADGQASQWPRAAAIFSRVGEVLENPATHFVILSVVSVNATVVFGEIMLREVCPAVISTDFTATSSDVARLSTTHTALSWVSRAILFVLLGEAMLVAICARMRFFRSWSKVSDVLIVAVAIAVEFAHYALAAQNKGGVPLASLWTNSTILASNSTGFTRIAGTTSAEGALLIFLLVWRIVRIIHGVLSVARSIRKHSARVVEQLNATIVWSPSKRHIRVNQSDEPLEEMEQTEKHLPAEVPAADTLSGDLPPLCRSPPLAEVDAVTISVTEAEKIVRSACATASPEIGSHAETIEQSCSMAGYEKPHYESLGYEPSGVVPTFANSRDLRVAEGPGEERRVTTQDLEVRLESLTVQGGVMTLVLIDVICVFGEIMLLEVCPKVTSTAFTATSADVSKLRYWRESLGRFSQAVMLIPLVHCVLLIVAYRLQFFRKWVMVVDFAVISVAVMLRYEPFYVEIHDEDHQYTARHADEVGGILFASLFWRVLRIVNGYYAKEESAAALAVEQVDDALRVLLIRLIEDMRNTSAGDLEVTTNGLEAAVSGLIQIIDVNGDGDMSRAELETGFKAYRADINKRAVASLIRRFDKNKTGQLDVRSFADGLLDFYKDNRSEFMQTELPVPCLAEEDEAALVPSSPECWSRGKVFPESPLDTDTDAPLPVAAQCVILPVPTPSFLEDSEFEAQMAVKASYYHRRRGSGDSNCSDAACSDAVTMPMLSDTLSANLPLTPVGGRGYPGHLPRAAATEPEDIWPVFGRTETPIQAAQLA